MALSAVGLKTHIWNNRIRSILFLAVYPLVITATYMSLFAVILLYAASQMDGHKEDVAFTQFYRMLVLDYWYVPYALVAIVLLVRYLRDRSTLNITADMQPVSRQKYPALYQQLETLCISRGLAMPMFFVQSHESYNAYTAGLASDTYRLIITSAAAEKLAPDEINALLAQQLTHIMNGDTQLLFLLSTVTGLITGIANVFTPRSRRSGYYDEVDIATSSQNTVALALFMLVLWCILQLGKLGSLFALAFVSKRREYIADAGAVELTKNPGALIRLLRSVERTQGDYPHLCSVPASLFHYRAPGSFSTHPKIDDRIAAVAYYNRMENPESKAWSRRNVKKAKQAKPELLSAEEASGPWLDYRLP